MNVIFYNYNSPAIAVSKELTNPSIYNVKLKADFDIIRPVLLLTATDVLDKDYCYIPDLKRYYFIEPPQRFVAKNTLEIMLRVDVLMTYKDRILASECLIYSTPSGNKYVDGAVVEKRRSILKLDFPTSFGTESYVLITANTSKVV